MADIKYIITADAKGVVKEVKKVESSIKGMKTQATQSVSPLKGMFTQLATGLVATIGIGIAFKKLVGFMKDSIEAAGIQELAEKGLTDALKSTGREVPINAAHFKAYASELQQATLYGDEAILGAQALLIQLTDLDKKGLERATAGALGMATVFKTDLKSATNLIAKALAGNYGALSRYGISVTDLNTEEEKRASLLDQLNVLYERAKGEVDTYEGTVTQLKNTFGDFQEKIGDVIVGSDELRGAIGSIQELLNNFIASGTMDSWASKFDLIIKNVPIFKSLKDSIFLLNMEMEGQIAKQKHATETGEKWLEFLEDSDKALNILGVDLYEAMRNLAGFGDEAETTKTKIAKLPIVIKEVEQVLFDMNDVVEDGVMWLERMKIEGEETGGVMEAVFDNLGLAYGDFGDEVEAVNEEINRNLEALGMNLSRSFGDAFEDILTKGTDFSDALNLLFDGLVNSIRNYFGQMVTDFLANNVFDFMSKAATEATKSVTETVGGLATGAGAAATGGATALATGLGAAAGTLIAGLITGKGGPSSTDSWHFREIWLNTNALIPMEGATDAIRDHTLRIAVQTEGIPRKQDIMNKHLQAIRDNLEGMPSGQGGLEFQSGSKGGFARYHPNEKVSIQPASPLSINMQSTPANIFLDGKKVGMALIKHFPELSKRGRMKMHPSVVNQRF